MQCRDLNGKRILVGITGGIAAYKVALLIRLLVRSGAEVQVVMTPAAKEFITPLTLSTLSGHPVVSEFFNERTGDWHSHVKLGLWADLFVIAPATASTLGKMANGIADNLLVTTYLSSRAPVLVAPAMDLDMYRHPSTTASLERLRSWGVEVVESECGELASHLVGQGRMAEPETIYEVIVSLLKPSRELQKKRILITSGPTYEQIDPVRFIGNYSTGKMGKALAEEAWRRGASITFVTGPVAEEQIPYRKGIEVIRVSSALEMLRACQSQNGAYDIAIFCAAVADYRVAEQATHKIKREEQGAMSIDLLPNPDIAATLGEAKREDQFHIGFALETHLSRVGVLDKMERKNLDLIVVNTLQDEGAGFGVATNKVTIIDSLGEHEEALPLMQKSEVAAKILDRMEQLLEE